MGNPGRHGTTLRRGSSTSSRARAARTGGRSRTASGKSTKAPVRCRQRGQHRTYLRRLRRTRPHPTRLPLEPGPQTLDRVLYCGPAGQACEERAERGLAAPARPWPACAFPVSAAPLRARASRRRLESGPLDLVDLVFSSQRAASSPSVSGRGGRGAL